MEIISDLDNNSMCRVVGPKLAWGGLRENG